MNAHGVDLVKGIDGQWVFLVSWPQGMRWGTQGKWDSLFHPKCNLLNVVKILNGIAPQNQKAGFVPFLKSSNVSRRENRLRSGFTPQLE